MSGSPQGWRSLELRRKRAMGGFAGVDAEEKNPLRGLFEHDEDRSMRLRLYMDLGPSGERNVEPILDKQVFPLRHGRQVQWLTRAERDTWLRGVLDACED